MSGEMHASRIERQRHIDTIIDEQWHVIGG
jgi:hypothetical protein